MHPSVLSMLMVGTLPVTCKQTEIQNMQQGFTNHVHPTSVHLVDAAIGGNFASYLKEDMRFKICSRNLPPTYILHLSILSLLTVGILPVTCKKTI